MIETIHNAKAFVENGYTLWDTPEGTGELINKIIPDFIDLVKNPPKEKWEFDLHRLNNPDIGLIIKNEEVGHDGTRYDKKTYLHYHPALWTHLGLRGIKLTQQQKSLLENCKELHTLFEHEALKFAELFSKGNFNRRFENRFSGGADYILRLLAYRDVRSDNSELIGARHKDQSCFTFAIRESSPGLEGSLYEGGPFVPISARSDRALVFPGGKFQDLPTQYGRVKPLWHRIRYVKSEEQEKNLVRWAVVFFAHGRGFKLKTSTH